MSRTHCRRCLTRWRTWWKRLVTSAISFFLSVSTTSETSIKCYNPLSYLKICLITLRSKYALAWRRSIMPWHTFVRRSFWPSFTYHGTISFADFLSVQIFCDNLPKDLQSIDLSTISTHHLPYLLDVNVSTVCWSLSIAEVVFHLFVS